MGRAVKFVVLILMQGIVLGDPATCLHLRQAVCSRRPVCRHLALARVRGGYGGTDSDADEDEDEDSDNLSRRRKERTPAQKMEKYKKMVKKLEEAKARLETRCTKLDLDEREFKAKTARTKTELGEEINALKKQVQRKNNTYAELEEQIDRYLLKTADKINSFEGLKSFLEELERTQDSLLKRKFELIQKQAESLAQKDNLALRTRILVLERQKKELEEKINILEDGVQLKPRVDASALGTWKSIPHVPPSKDGSEGAFE
mmetsp:Transcript_20395/g.50067  ORF Transcript_20395/g.50067 Transcript_20395/m.50067 type:complete len:260 (+) Transcript_20395:1-780(+)